MYVPLRLEATPALPWFNCTLCLLTATWQGFVSASFVLKAYNLVCFFFIEDPFI